ncbi:type II secretion system F family protein [Vibrio hippocampi]|uniref:Type II secretion system protein F n=1 Tax=Vibrio hippocampi TaxID=654686 RepID=A0ABM8ZJB9_9VIBR|nr:type II secretion system F family protein [Vibrio hippocampi]CAH0526989.1 Type II secretion system protein F [Vibrio hippocampi]
MADTASNPIQLFHWEGYDNNGVTHQGEWFSSSSDELQQQLRQHRIEMTTLSKRRFSKLKSVFNPVNRTDVTLIANQLATMLEAGVNIDYAIKLIEHTHNKYSVKLLLYRLHCKITAGLTLSEALREFHTCFDQFFVQMVTTGEQTGKLSETLCLINLYREKQQMMRAKITKAFIYPITVLLAAVIVCYIMLTKVIPQFETMFAQFDAPLPKLTQTVIYASAWVSAHGTHAAMIIGITVTLLGLIYRHHLATQRRVHHYVLTLPLFGSLLLKSIVVQVARTLVICTQSGLPLLSGLQLSYQLLTNRYVAEQLKQVESEVSAGTAIHSAMRTTQAFPEMLLQMVMIGEESGQLEKTLTHLIQRYELDIEQVVDNLNQVLEPFIVIILGVIIGGLVLAMYLPLFNLLSVLG